MLSDDALRTLRTGIESAATVDDLLVLAVPGVATDEGKLYGPEGAARYGVLVFTEPVPAPALCAAMGWARAYAFSPDVHQTLWEVGLWVADLADPYGPRIYTQPPRLGAWRVAARLTGRPPGPLPGVAAGASPAYPLDAYPAAVARLELYAA